MSNEIIIYQSKDNQTLIDVTFENDTIWLTQKQMSVLFDRNRVTITQHIQTIFNDGELNEHVVCKDFLLTTQHGAIEGKMQQNKIKLYNLDVIISVGYRVKSMQGTQFRQCATARLKDYLVKVYALNQKRLDELSQKVSIIAQ